MKKGTGVQKSKMAAEKKLKSEMQPVFMTKICKIVGKRNEDDASCYSTLDTLYLLL
jgi:hypothetical protein